MEFIARHPDIKFQFYADTQLFVHISNKNTALAFDKLNLCLHDVKGWMSLSMFKLKTDKTEFIIFGCHAQLKKLVLSLPVTIFGNFIHPAVDVKNLGVWFDANFSFADYVHNICKICFIQMHDLRWVRLYLLLSWWQTPWRVVIWTTATLFSEVCLVSTSLYLYS